jgi:hypothetical protein
MVLMLDGCALDEPGMEIHAVRDPKAGRVNVAIRERGEHVYDVSVYEPGFITFPSPKLLETKLAYTELAKNMLVATRCQDKVPTPIDGVFENHILNIRFECR